jgi:hypothetical protein
MNISKVYIYDEPQVPEIEINNLAKFISDTLCVTVEKRKNIFEYFKMDSNAAYELDRLRISNPYLPFELQRPTKEEIDFEEDSVFNRSASSGITMYDGFELQNFLAKIIPNEELSLEGFHLIFTTKLICTYDYNDYRYHGRSVICSNPAIISTTGIIEAPAKPREYYIGISHNIIQGQNLDLLKTKFRGKFLEYHDKNLCKVIKGYTLQAIFNHLNGLPFCDSKDCILYNAHWQEDLMHSQIEMGKLCNRHQLVLEIITKS